MNTSIARTGHSLIPETRKISLIYILTILVEALILSIVDKEGNIVSWLMNPIGTTPLLQVYALKARSALLLTAAIATAAYVTRPRSCFLYLVVTMMFMAFSLALVILYGIFAVAG